MQRPSLGQFRLSDFTGPDVANYRGSQETIPKIGKQQIPLAARKTIKQRTMSTQYANAQLSKQSLHNATCQPVH